MRARGAYLNLTLVALVALVLGVLLLTRSGGTGTPGVTVSASASPRGASEAFALAYAKVLDGAAPAAGLPSATLAVRRLAAGTVVPAPDRHGALVLSQLSVTAESGQRARATFTARDGRNSFPAVLGLARTDAGWVVAGLIPPDLSTILRPAAPSRGIPPSASHAAAAFARAYVNYREHASNTPPQGLGPLQAQLSRGRDPLAFIAPTHAPAGSPSLSYGPIGDGTLDASATVEDAGHQLSITFILKRSRGRWQPWWIASGSAR